MNRRRALLAALLVGVGLSVGVVFLVTEYPLPTSHKDLPYLDIRVGDVPAGVPKFFLWNDVPFALVRTSGEMLDDLQAQTPHTWSQHPIPADRPAFFVYSLVSPVLGCVARHAPKGAFRFAPERLWQGGFYDPCHFAEWDYAGRAIRQYPDQGEWMRVADLDVPAFELRTPDTLRIHR